MTDRAEIKKGSTEHAILAFLAALLDTGKTPKEILTALDVIREILMRD